MNRHLTTIALLLLSVPVAVAQETVVLNVVVLSETPLYERPTVEAPSRATLPAGVRLTLSGRQGDWMAVATSEGLIGWIPRSVAHVEGPSPAAAPPPAVPPGPGPSFEGGAAPGQASAGPAAERPYGFFNRPRRAALSFGAGTLGSAAPSVDPGTAQRVVLSSARMVGRRFEWGLRTVGSRYNVVRSDPWYELQFGAHANVFLVQPSPVGAYAGVLVAWTTHYLGSEVTSKVTASHWGGEAGVFLQLRRRALIVPRAAVRVERVGYTGQDRPSPFVVSEGVARDGTITSARLGVDFDFGGFVPGLWYARRDGTQFVTLRATFSF